MVTAGGRGEHDLWAVSVWVAEQHHFWRRSTKKLPDYMRHRYASLVTPDSTILSRFRPSQFSTLVMVFQLGLPKRQR